jgi:hypothetical protein
VSELCETEFVGSRIRRIGSIKAELIAKSREAALSAIRVFNDPMTKFKSESFIVLMIIAWTYLLHAYYRSLLLLLGLATRLATLPLLAMILIIQIVYPTA